MPRGTARAGASKPGLVRDPELGLRPLLAHRSAQSDVLVSCSDLASHQWSSSLDLSTVSLLLRSINELLLDAPTQATVNHYNKASLAQ